MDISNYTASKIEKLQILGEKTLALIAFQANAPEEATDRYFDDTYNQDINYTLKRMPEGYSQALAWLIRQYSTREGEQK